ncbi:hypothetical protein [Spirosoma fluviale]|nr:hypothetical protein [Spirosoma fluviale]
MYPILSKWYIAPGNEIEAIAVLKELPAKVRASEPESLKVV